MSAQELITDHLDLWTGAVTHKNGSGRGSNGRIELTGIKKLRELILELAVRGKLVEQDPSDEPASVLLDRITEEKARLVKEGKIRRSKSQPAVELEEVDFELPNSWIWVRLGSVGQVVGGGTPKSGEPSYWSEKEIAWLTPADLYGLNEKYISFGKRDISRLGLEKSSAQLLPEGAVLFSSRAPIGYVAIAAKELATNQGFKSCATYILDVSHFVYYFLKRSARHIDASASGTTFKEISGSKFASIPMPLPPLEEQLRIVEKVDELMALCDRLEQQVGDQLEAHEVLVDTLLDALTSSVDAAEVAENWARVADHFDTLFTTEASIDKLKQTILQLAVMGRLVPQESDDEPASRLLDKLAEEKARLVKEGKIKKPKRLPPIENNERSYQVHENWAWVRFQNIANEISTGPFGSMIHKHDYINNGVPLINPSHMINGSIQEDVSVSISPQKAEELSSYKLNESDIVMARRGEVGRCAIVSDREAGWLCGTGSFVLRFHEALSRRFILMMFATDGVRRYLAGNSVGTTMTNLNHGILNRMPVALPPINEQHRIVQKVDELMALCDRLKARLGEAGETRAQLAETVVEQAVS